jgi:adenylyltransferase/sulfurtransferase
MEAIKVLLGMTDTLTGRVLYFDAQAMEFEQVTLEKNPHCRVCGTN